MEKKTLVLGIIIGAVFAWAFAPMPAESAIPPTRAFPIIEVLTSPWFGSDFNVTSDSYADTVHYVSDGSIWFNVTETYP